MANSHPFLLTSVTVRHLCTAVGLSLLPAVILLGAVNAKAQAAKPSKPRYVRFPVRGDFETVLKNLLGRVKDGRQFKDEFQKLLKKLQNDPTQLPKGLEKFKDLIGKLDLKNNPLIKQQFEDLIKEQTPKNIPIDDKQFQKFKEEILKNWKFPDSKKPPKTADGGGANPPEIDNDPLHGGRPNPVGVGGPGGNKPAKPEPPKDDPFRDTLKAMLEDIGESDLADFLKESDGFQNMLSDFGKLLSSDENGFFDMDAKGIAEWFAEMEAPAWDVDLPQPEGWPFGEMSMPEFPTIDFKPPSFSAPSVGSPPPASSIAPTLLVLFLVFGGGVLMFYLLRASPWSPLSRRGKHAWKIGPWPLDPARISTPGELIVAFNYLSKLFGGPQAENWNHKQAAETMGEKGRENSSHELASLYEKARYNPDDPLTHNDIQQAAQHVSSLAGKTR